LENWWTLVDSPHPLSFLAEEDHLVQRGTGDCGGDSESELFYPVPETMADKVSVWVLVLSTNWDQTLHGLGSGLEWPDTQLSRQTTSNYPSLFSSRFGCPFPR
jgi:hypothetical protein